MNIRAILPIFLAISGTLLLHAQENKQSFMEWLVEDDVLEQQIHPIHPIHPMRLMEQSFPAKQVDSSIDVISYDVYADWYMALMTPRADRPDRKTTARVKAVVRSRVDDLNSVVFDGVAMVFDSVTSGGSRITFTKNAFSITMNLPTPLQRGQEVELTIYYANSRDRGAIFIWSKEDANAINIPYASGYTISQPEDARKWYPCNDQPDDKALFTSHMRVPKGFTFVSNGVQYDSVADGDTATIQSWRTDIPMSTYLFSMNASEYVNYPMTYTRPDKSTIPISNYQFDVDVDGSPYSAKNAYKNLGLIFQSMEERFGVYPYATYGHVAVDPFQYGGMEHQTMSTVNRIWLNGNYEAGIVHEVAHQWLGDDVTCGTWADIWLNEGGASWSEALWAEFRSGSGGYREVLWAKRDNYMRFGLAEPPIYDIPIGNIFNTATTYSKSAWVYHMMRTLVGDDAIFPALRGYIAKFARSSAQTFQLLDHLKATIPNPPVAWDVFFDQWLVKAGHPIFEVAFRKLNGPTATTYRVNISQTQSKADVPDVFFTPLRLRLIGFGYVLDTLVMINARSVDFEIDPGFEVDNLLVDNENEVLCEKNISVVSVSEAEDQSLWCRLLGTHPIAVGSPLRVQCDDAPTANVTIRTISGELASSAVISHGVSLVNTVGLMPGAYSVTVASGLRTARFTILITAQ